MPSFGPELKRAAILLRGWFPHNAVAFHANEPLPPASQWPQD
jgi:hypothetical protein